MSRFVDLRPHLHHDAAGSEDSFWPSFTDIMMVVVMIFLVTSSVTFVRNWHLVQDLTKTVEAEKLAREIAQNSMAQNVDLGEQLANVESRLEDEQTAKTQVEQALANSRETLASLNSEIASKTANLASLSDELGSTRTQLAAVQQEREAVNASLETARIRHSRTTPSAKKTRNC